MTPEPEKNGDGLKDRWAEDESKATGAIAALEDGIQQTQKKLKDQKKKLAGLKRQRSDLRFLQGKKRREKKADAETAPATDPEDDPDYVA